MGSSNLCNLWFFYGEYKIMKRNSVQISLPGMIPLIILIVAELLWGMVTGLWLAVLYGLGEMAYYALRYKRFEKSSLYDTGLLTVLGIVALALDGALLDRIRPMIYMLIVLMMVGLSAFSNFNFLMAASGRFLKNRKFGLWETEQMRITMKYLFWWMAGYFLLLFVGLWIPSEVGEFLSKTGLYVFIALALASVLILKKIQNKRWINEEWLPLVEADGNVIGAAPRSVVHNGKSRWLHPVVHIQVIKEGGLWLQKRPLHKLVQPGKWDTAVGGHIAANETVELSIQREAAEEIGVEIKDIVVLGRYQWESPLENELVFAFAIKHEGPIHPHPEELDGGKVWSFNEIDENIGKGIFTPNFEREYGLYKSRLIGMV
jgi:isopentenyldiphosphate isomerase